MAGPKVTSLYVFNNIMITPRSRLSCRIVQREGRKPVLDIRWFNNPKKDALDPQVRKGGWTTHGVGIPLECVTALQVLLSSEEFNEASGATETFNNSKTQEN